MPTSQQYQDTYTIYDTDFIQIVDALQYKGGILSGWTTRTGTGIQVIVNAGRGLVDKAIRSTGSDTTINLVAAESNPRKDLIVILADGTTFSAIKGTAIALDPTDSARFSSIKPKPADPPAGAIVLAEVFVPANATQFVDEDVRDRRLFIKTSYGSSILVANDFPGATITDKVNNAFAAGTFPLKEVWMEPGDYTVSTTTYMAIGDRYHLRGYGAKLHGPSTGTQQGWSDFIFTRKDQAGASNIIIEGLEFDMSGLTLGAEFYAIVVNAFFPTNFKDIPEITIRDCYFRNAGTTALYLNCDNSSNGDETSKGRVLIQNCVGEIPSSGTTGFFFKFTTVPEVTVRDCKFQGYGTTAQKCFYFDLCTRVFFQGIHFRGFAPNIDGVGPIIVDDTRGPLMIDTCVFATDDVISSIKPFLVIGPNPFRARSIMISDCYFGSETANTRAGAGILIRSSDIGGVDQSDITVRNCTFRYGWEGIRIKNAENAQMAGFKFIDNDFINNKNCIELDGTTSTLTGMEIVGNTFKNSPQAGGTGIILRGKVNGTLIKDNTFTFFSTLGAETHGAFCIDIQSSTVLSTILKDNTYTTFASTTMTFINDAGTNTKYLGGNFPHTIKFEVRGSADGTFTTTTSGANNCDGIRQWDDTNFRANNRITGNAANQELDVIYRLRLPEDFRVWTTNTAIDVETFTTSTNTVDAAAQVYVYDSAGATSTFSVNTATGTAYQSIVFGSVSLVGTFTPGRPVTVRCRGKVDGGWEVRFGRVNFRYLAEGLPPRE